MTLLTAAPLSSRSQQRHLQDLMREARAHRSLNHPYLTALANGTFADQRQALAEFARKYHGYTKHFTDYLVRVIDKLDNPAHKELLTQNLTEEQGHLHEDDLDALRAVGIDPTTIDGIPHKDLFLRFGAAIGLSDVELANPGCAARKWRREFIAFLDSASPAAAVGALGLGTENIVKHIYRPIIDGIARLGTIAAEDSVFFDLHCTVDDQHAEDLNNVALELMEDPQSRAELRHGMLTALRLRERFWDHMLASQTKSCAKACVNCQA